MKTFVFTLKATFWTRINEKTPRKLRTNIRLDIFISVQMVRTSIKFTLWRFNKNRYFILVFELILFYFYQNRLPTTFSYILFPVRRNNIFNYTNSTNVKQNLFILPKFDCCSWSYSSHKQHFLYFSSHLMAIWPERI